MASDYIPGPDAEALGWLQTFANGYAESPETYGGTSIDAGVISSEVASFAAALADSIDPAQRSPMKTAIKSECRSSAEQLVRGYANLIKYNAGISNAAKIAIGVRPVNNSRTTINVPASSPLLNVIGATPGAQTVRFADSNTPDTGKKPFGALQLQLFVAVGTDPVAAPDAASFYGAFTKNPIAVGFDAADNRKVATYFARWASRRGDVGPWSLPVSMAIAA